MWLVLKRTGRLKFNVSYLKSKLLSETNISQSEQVITHIRLLLRLTILVWLDWFMVDEC